MRNILSDSSKSPQVSATEDKQLNFIVNVEKRITDLLKDLKISKVIFETVYKILFGLVSIMLISDTFFIQN